MEKVPGKGVAGGSEAVEKTFDPKPMPDCVPNN